MSALPPIADIGEGIAELNFLLKPNELEKVVRDAGLKLIVTVKHFKELADALPAEVVFLEDLPIKRRMILRSIRPLPPAPRVDPDDTALGVLVKKTGGDNGFKAKISPDLQEEAIGKFRTWWEEKFGKDWEE